MAWTIEFTEDAEAWIRGLDEHDFDRIAPAIDLLEQHGPALGRPTVDRIKGSRHHNMKELRSRGGHLRVLFCFDPSRQAILLVGGDKTDNWQGWYEESIPLADRLYDRHLQSSQTRGR